MTDETIFLGPTPAEESCVQVGSDDCERRARAIKKDRRGIVHKHSTEGLFAPIHGDCKYLNGKRVSTPEYRSWQAMRTRCNNPNFKEWHLYGGKGITIDPRWDDYSMFLADMGRRPSPQHTLDRIDSAKGYYKENCRWATPVVQSRNTSRVRLSMELARYIRANYVKGKWGDSGPSAKALADELGVSIHAIKAVAQGKCWREPSDPSDPGTIRGPA